MARQIVVGFVLLAFVNFLMGCMVTSTEKLSDQAAQQEAQKITQLVLLDGITITCKPTGAVFLQGTRGLRGRSVMNQPLFVSLHHVRECRVSHPQSIALAESDSAWIAEVVLWNNLLVSFRDPGARYDRTTGRVTGTSDDGRQLSYEQSKLRSARSVRPIAMSVADLELHPEQPVYEVVDRENIVIAFDSTGAHVEQQKPVFVGTDAEGRPFEVASTDVLYANIERVDPAGTALATLGVIVGSFLLVGLIIAATKQSCPFVYSYNGQRYIFDAEPLGGSICRGLARTDISRLDHVQSTNGEYRLLVRNEVPETQYIDRMRLLVVDHPSGMHVYPDLEGNFFAFSTILGPSSAYDDKGRSLMKFLCASDNVAWQTDLQSASKTQDDSVRHTLTVTLPMPVGAKKAWLVTNVGTSLWGSNMIRKIVEYRGNVADAWLDSFAPGTQSFVEMQHLLDREELYHLKTWVKEGEGWNQGTVLQGQGPLISEDRVYPIDVSSVPGDSLVLRFNPPKGFWTFDFLGVSYEEPRVMSPVSVSALRAEDEKGASYLDSLRNIDGTYYSMPSVGDRAYMGFAVPLQREGVSRAVYLETNGYYRLHLPKDKADQLDRLFTIWLNPGQIVKEAMQEFRTWQAQQRMVQNEHLH